MHWRDSAPKGEQRETYMAHIEAILSEFASGERKYKAHDVSQNPTTLDTEPEWREDGMPLLPFQLHGTTDVLIELMDLRDSIETAEAPGSPPMLQNTRVVLQIKKPPMTKYDRCVRQSMGELFATDVKAAAPVVAVLTDLVDDWTFQWLAVEISGVQAFHCARLQKKTEGIVALASVLKSTKAELEEYGLVKVRALRVGGHGL